jgi:LAO/AO transport system kinase
VKSSSKIFDVRRVLVGDRREIARAISAIERQSPAARPLLTALYPHTGTAHIVGITGAPGTGKSTLVNQIACTYRQKLDVQVGILAIDPTSPFSGGALLGDRIRMCDLAGDPGVFIRSLATRGAVGGLSRSTAEAAQVLDAAGFDVVLIETVGAGQDEVEIAHTAHTTIVVEAPGLGDDIQAIKAGIVEIADIFVVNKADRAGAEATARALQFMLESGDRLARQAAIAAANGADKNTVRWQVPVCKTVALDGTGLDELVSQLDAHRAYLRSSGRLEAKERARAQANLVELLRQELFSRFLLSLETGELEDAVSDIASRQMSPYETLERLLNTPKTPETR